MSIEQDLKDESLWAEGFQTRDGRPVRIYAIDGNKKYPVHGAYFETTDGWSSCSWTGVGGFDCQHRSEKLNTDIIRRPVKRKGWISFCEHPNRTVIAGASHVLLTKEEAMMNPWSDERMLACIEIEFTEGDGLQ